MAISSPAVLAAARSLAIDRVTAEVTSATARAGVATVLLKGPSIATWLYPGGRDRTYIDCDLLIPPNERVKTERILAALGFEDILSGAKPDERDAHGSPWRRSRDNVCIDLHRTLPGVRAADEDVWSILTDHLDSMSVGGVSVQVLNDSARLLLIALHAAHNGVRNSQSLTDLVRAIDQVPERSWHRAADLARALDGLPAFAAGLRLVPAGTRLAARLGLLVSPSVEVQLRAMSAPRLALGFEALTAKPGLVAKLDYLWQNLVPTSAFMRFWSPLAGRGLAGMAAAYVWRWLWLAAHVVPGYLAWKRVRRQSPLSPQ